MISLADRPFQGPFPLSQWTGSAVGGVYSLMVQDPERGYRPVYVGETGNFLERGFPPARRGSAGWLALADFQQSLYIAVHPLPGPTERKAVERDLIQTYQPECNEALAPRSILVH
jgi:hypothetical protein